MKSNIQPLKYILLIFISLLTLLSGRSAVGAGAAPASFNAGVKDLGVGVILFGPTGFSGNYFVNRAHSIDMAAAWGMGEGKQKLYLHGTYLWHRPKFLNLEKFDLDFHYGFGGRIISWDDPPGKDQADETRLGIRGSTGLSYTFPKPRIEVFGELSINMDVVPETDADIDLAIGGRFYF